MKQQVNLYRAEFSRRSRNATVSRARLALIMAGVAIGALVGVDVWRVVELRAELSDTIEEEAALNMAMSEYKINVAMEDPVLAGIDLNALEIQLNDTRSINSVLKEYLGNASMGFSHYFVAFARQHIKGLWLTSISIMDAGVDIAFTGKSVDPALVPQYVAQLGSEAVLHGIRFRALRIAKPEKDTPKQANYVEFAIASDDQLESMR